MHQQSLYLFIFLIKIKACRFCYKVDDISQGSLSNFKTQVTFFGHCTVLGAHVSEHGYSITHVFNVPCKAQKGLLLNLYHVTDKETGDSEESYFPSQHRQRV